MKKSKVLSIISLILVLVFVSVGCGGNPATTAPENPTGSQAAETQAGGEASATGSKTLKIGVSAPLTGPFAKTGQETKDAVALRLEELNNEWAGYKLEVVWIDDQGDPDVGVRAYEQAIVKDGIQVGLFCNFSSVAVAEMEIAAKYGIPHFCSWGQSALVDEKWASDEKYHNWYKLMPQPIRLSVNIVAAVDEMVNNGTWVPEAEKFFVYGEDNDWGRSLGSTLGAKFQEIGWELVGEEYFTAGETDFYSLMTKIKSSGAALMVGTSNSVNSASAFIKQARETNTPALIYMEAFTENGDFYELNGEASDYILDCRAAYMNDPTAGEAFNKKFLEKFGYNTSAANGGFIYDCFNWFLAVVEATDASYGDVNSEKLIQFGQEEIQTGKFVWTDGMVMPAIQYSTETMPEPVIGKDAYIFPILQIKEGKINVVYPTEYKTTDLLLPDYVVNNAN